MEAGDLYTDWLGSSICGHWAATRRYIGSRQAGTHIGTHPPTARSSSSRRRAFNTLDTMTAAPRVQRSMFQR